MSGYEKLFDVLCCCGDDHTIGEGGKTINIVQLKKKAEWPYLTAVNVLMPKSKDYPLACAVICDRCLKGKAEIKYAMVGRKGEGEVRIKLERIPMEQLKDPEYYWPDHHPQRWARAA